MRKNIKNKKGFLLIEILVAVFIFTIVMLVSLASVIALLDANRKNQAIKSVVNNLNLMVNSMVKSIFVGDKYFCGVNDSGSGNGSGNGSSYNYTGGSIASDCDTIPKNALTFRFTKDAVNPPEGLDVYRFKYVETNPVNQTGSIFRSIDSTTNYIAITAPEVKITYFRVYVYGTAPLFLNTANQRDVEQPRVTIIIRGYAGEKSTIRSQFNIQTTISQRDQDKSYQQL